MSIHLAKSFRLPSVQHISVHCWSPDGLLLALSPNSNELMIFQQLSSGSWSLLHSLAIHTQKITGLDWSSIAAPNGDVIHRIVSCSEDRNAYVWTFPSSNLNSIKYELVILKIEAGATIVRWSPSGMKFAIGSVSSKTPLSICHYDADARWWTSRPIATEDVNGLDSGILALCWHPSSVLISIGTISSAIFVLSAFVKGIDSKPDDCEKWGDRFPFGTVCLALGKDKKAPPRWINAMAFSPDGNQVAVTESPSAAIRIVSAASTSSTILQAPDSLPLLSLLWVDPSLIIAAGFSGRQCCYSKDSNGSWFIAFEDQRLAPSTGEAKKKSSSSLAFSKFKSLVLTGQKFKDGDEEDGVALEDSSGNYPKSTIRFVNSNFLPYSELRSTDVASKMQFSSSSFDGILSLWNIQESANMTAKQIAVSKEDLSQLKL
ncbi:ARP2/3 actin-organizing complex subunit Sop2 [Mitosporidium daphniae]